MAGREKGDACSLQPHKADLGQEDGRYKKIDFSAAQGDMLTCQRQPKVAQGSTGCNGGYEPQVPGWADTDNHLAGTLG